MKYLFVLLLVGLMVGCGEVEDTRPLCDKVDGLQIADESLVPSDYTGVVKRCEDGKVQRLLNYKDGKQDGLEKSWYSSGQLWFESNYKDGKKNGLERCWMHTGQLSSEDNWKDGNLISNKCWDEEDGTLIKCPKRANYVDKVKGSDIPLTSADKVEGSYFRAVSFGEDGEVILHPKLTPMLNDSALKALIFDKSNDSASKVFLEKYGSLDRAKAIEKEVELAKKYGLGTHTNGRKDKSDGSKTLSPIPLPQPIPTKPLLEKFDSLKVYDTKRYYKKKSDRLKSDKLDSIVKSLPHLQK